MTDSLSIEALKWKKETDLVFLCCLTGNDNNHGLDKDHPVRSVDKAVQISSKLEFLSEGKYAFSKQKLPFPSPFYLAAEPIIVKTITIEQIYESFPKEIKSQIPDDVIMLRKLTFGFSYLTNPPIDINDVCVRISESTDDLLNTFDNLKIYLPNKEFRDLVWFKEKYVIFDTQGLELKPGSQFNIVRPLLIEFVEE